MRLQILVELLLGQVSRVEARARGHRLVAEEGLVLVEAVPRAEEGVEPVEQRRIVPGRDLRPQLVVIRRALALVDFAHQVRRLDQQADHLALLGVEEAGVRPHVDAGKLLDRAGLLRAAFRVLRLGVRDVARGDG